jgi:hypothetical protein
MPEATTQTDGITQDGHMRTYLFNYMGKLHMARATDVHQARVIVAFALASIFGKKGPAEITLERIDTFMRGPEEDMAFVERLRKAMKENYREHETATVLGTLCILRLTTPTVLDASKCIGFVDAGAYANAHLMDMPIDDML